MMTLSIPPLEALLAYTQAQSVPIHKDLVYLILSMTGDLFFFFYLLTIADYFRSGDIPALP